MDKITVTKIDEVYLKIDSTESILREISDYFTFTIPNFHFKRKKDKRGRRIKWDGKKKLFKLRSRKLYIGLLPSLEKFAKNFKYTLDIQYNHKDAELSTEDGIKFIKSLAANKTPRDYQIKGFLHAMRKKRVIIESPTASGKSLMIYYMVRYLQSLGLKGILIVPTVNLVNQMYTDFEDYAQNSDWDVEASCHKIFAGQEKVTRKDLAISTWQSVYELPKMYFQKYDYIIGDEAHEFAAKSLIEVMEKLDSASYRIGTTGTLNDERVAKLTLEGLFGKVKNWVKTKELVEKDILSKLEINAFVFNYPEKVKRRLYRAEYDDEMKFLIANEYRNNRIKNLVLNLKGNTLILYRYVEKHGIILHDMISKALPDDRNCHLIHGETDAEIREQIRKGLEEETDSVLVASFGTFSRGSNVRNLSNLVFASPVKSKIRVLQSIGRVLRKSDKKEKSVLYDFGDDLRWNDYENFSIKHLEYRLGLYINEGFDYKMYRVNIV